MGQKTAIEYREGPVQPSSCWGEKKKRSLPDSCRSTDYAEKRGGQITYSLVVVGVMLGRDVGQSLDLQHPGRVQNRRQLLVGDAHFPVVHEAQQGFHVAVLDVAQDHDRMLARVSLFINIFIEISRPGKFDS